MRTYPTDYDPEACIFVPIPIAFAPFCFGKIAELESELEWKTYTDWKLAYPVIAEIEEVFMNCMQLQKDLFVLQAKALGLDYIEALEASLPAGAAALYDAEQKDTTHALDTIHRFGNSPNQESQAQLVATIVKALLAALTSLPTAQIDAASVALADATTSQAQIDDIKEKSLYRETDQTEEYFFNLQSMLAPPGIGVSDP